RSAGGTKVGLPSVVVACTKSTIAFFAAPSFHEGSGSVWAKAGAPALTQTISARSRGTRRSAGMRIMTDLLLKSGGALASDCLRGHGNDDRVATQAQHQPGPLRVQMQDHPLLVLHPEIAAARRADREAVAGLAIRSGKLGDVAEVVHLARRVHGGQADAADA